MLEIFLEEGGLEEIEKNEQPFLKPMFELLVVDSELAPKKAFDAEKSIVDEGTLSSQYRFLTLS
jgi:hypothetical protein